jgi:hypothetical protein
MVSSNNELVHYKGKCHVCCTLTILLFTLPERAETEICLFKDGGQIIKETLITTVPDQSLPFPSYPDPPHFSLVTTFHAQTIRHSASASEGNQDELLLEFIESFCLDMGLGAPVRSVERLNSPKCVGIGYTAHR